MTNRCRTGNSRTELGSGGGAVTGTGGGGGGAVSDFGCSRLMGWPYTWVGRTAAAHLPGAGVGWDSRRLGDGTGGTGEWGRRSLVGVSRIPEDIPRRAASETAHGPTSDHWRGSLSCPNVAAEDRAPSSRQDGTADRPLVPQL
ncbi:hypothetical protein GCM10010430_59170 [Kitasatospora cystarginea]|uniref:Uncharacterized protein n=1 Tax=Kitasatospora cystarginea TaxID=58350 RepID=A0ABN3EPY5_9ACTN